MASTRKKQSVTLLFGDLAVFILSLWLTLSLRYLEIPNAELLSDHLVPFLLLFVIWLLVFFITGLYDSHTLLLKSKLPSRIFVAHISNILIAVLFFYAIPYFGVTPKVVLFLYLIVSSLLIALWRFVVYPSLSTQTRIPLIVLAEGKDVDYLKQWLDSSSNSPVKILEIIKPSEFVQTEFVQNSVVSSSPSDSNIANDANSSLVEKIQTLVAANPQAVIAVDLINPHVQKHADELYKLIFTNVQFVEIQNIYEDVTDMVPLGLINEVWFLKHASIEPNVIYDSIKRVLDVCIALPLCIVPALTYPFIWIAMKMEDGGPFFYGAERIGEGNVKIKMYKVRSMSVMDEGNQLGSHANKITRVGKMIRVSRLDEFAQLWLVLSGKLSLIGPRPEFPKLVELYSKEIPHYNVRHLIKPGLSGWAQIHHEKPPHSIEETREKLAYDLYYIKHRSVWLDLKIALQTVKTLLSRVGV